jgi:hypothetical protein
LLAITAAGRVTLIMSFNVFECKFWNHHGFFCFYIRRNRYEACHCPIDDDLQFVSSINLFKVNMLIILSTYDSSETALREQ